MVKPPKSMQPEGIAKDLELAANDPDSKKRKNPHRGGMGGDTFRHYMARKIDMQRSQFGIANHLPPSPSELELTPAKKTRNVHFEREDPAREEIVSPSTNRTSNKDAGTSMASLLARLKRKHGSRKRKRAGSSSLMSVDNSSTSSSPLVPSKTTERIEQPDDHEKADRESATCSSTATDIKKRRLDLFFYGIVVLVNGYTNPDNDTLQRMLHRYGGDRETYETTRLTHIVAEHLSFAKAQIYKKRKKPIPVVKPQWIVDCVQQQRLLPHGPYLIDEVKEKGSISVASFFGKKLAATSKVGKWSQGKDQFACWEDSPSLETFEAVVDSPMQCAKSIRTSKSPLPCILTPQPSSSNQRVSNNKTTIDTMSPEQSQHIMMDDSPHSGLIGYDTMLLTQDAGILYTQPQHDGDYDSADNEKSPMHSCPANMQDNSPIMIAPQQAPLKNIDDGIVMETPQDKSNSFFENNGILRQTPEYLQDEVLQTPTSDIALQQHDANGTPNMHAVLSTAAATTVMYCEQQEHDDNDDSSSMNGTVWQTPQQDLEASPQSARNDEHALFSSNKYLHTIANDERTNSNYINGKPRTTGTDPDFLESFFKKSRLSFIGSFKQRARSPLELSATALLRNENFRRFVFHVDMDCFFASVVLRNFPEHRNKPVAISHHGKKDGSTVGPIPKTSWSECATCNYEARTYGIKKGMFLGRARELCPSLVVLQYDFDGYEEVSEQVADILYRYAGEYGGAVEQVSCDEAYVEIHLPVSEDDKSIYEVAKDIGERIREDIFVLTECTATIGIGANKLLAKLGTDKAKPNGCHVVVDFGNLLHSLKLRDLHGIGSQSQRKLSNEGLGTVKDVWDLGEHAESVLCRVLGVATGKKICAFCRGEDDREVKAAERKTIGAECNYGVRFDGPYGPDYMIHGLAKEVQKRMLGVGVIGSRICLKVKELKANTKFLGPSTCHSFSKSADLPMATNDDAILARFGLQLFHELAILPNNIRGMGIMVSKLSLTGNCKSGADGSRLSRWFQSTVEGENRNSNIGGEETASSFKNHAIAFEIDGVNSQGDVEFPANEKNSVSTDALDEIIDDPRQLSPRIHASGSAIHPSLTIHHQQTTAFAQCTQACDDTVTLGNIVVAADRAMDGDNIPETKQQHSTIGRPLTILNGKTDSKHIGGKLRTTGTDPDFLESFFNNSRLSFIGSYKQRARNSPTKPVSIANKTTVCDSKRFVFHVDMDCFFASVVLRNFPEHRKKPVAISHYGNKDGSSIGLVSKTSSSECATCNYEARTYGIKKGMFLGRARELCPKLVVLQYDFEGYEEVSEQVADILYRYAGEYGGTVEQVSCDEAYVEIWLHEDSGSVQNEVKDIAQRIRREIYRATECTASIGIGSNKLLAKLGTDKIKPNGSHLVVNFRELLEPLKLRDLHGIGYRTERKLSAENLITVKDVWDLGDHAEGELCRILGTATGKKILAFCRGEDDREVKPAVRKTIGAECNYGVRFDGPYGVDYMINGLAQEVHRRMVGVGVVGSRMCLKVKQRKHNAKPPPKFLGHGSCHSLSRSMDIPGGAAVNDGDIFARFGLQLFRELAIELDDVRGMGIVVSKLSTGHAKGGDIGNRLSCWLQPKLQIEAGTDNEVEIASFRKGLVAESNLEVSNEEQHFVDDERAVEDNDNDEVEILSNNEAAGDAISRSDETIDDDVELPPQSQIHMSQVAALPSSLKRKIEARLQARQRRDAADEIEINNADEDPNWKQTNVKHLFQLAAVKAGKDSLSSSLGESVSLTQLACLPFEMQLEVANNRQLDSTSAGMPAASSSTGIRARASTTRGRRVAPVSPKKLFQPASESGVASYIEPDLVQVADSDEENEVDEPTILQTFASPQTVDHRALYREDIAPLQQYLSESASSDMEAVERVGGFLAICAKEGRLQQVVVLLRSIKNRQDGWGGPIYSQILDRVDAIVQEQIGSQLDRTWLGL